MNFKINQPIYFEPNIENCSNWRVVYKQIPAQEYFFENSNIFNFSNIPYCAIYLGIVKDVNKYACHIIYIPKLNISTHIPTHMNLAKMSARQNYNQYWAQLNA